MTTMQNGAPGGAADGRALPWRERMRRLLDAGHRPVYGCSAEAGVLPADHRTLLGIEATRRLAVVIGWLQAIRGHDEGMAFAVVLDACDALCAEPDDAVVEAEVVELRAAAIGAACSLLDLVEQYGACRRASSVRHWLSGVVGARVGCELPDGTALQRRRADGVVLWWVDRRPTYRRIQDERGRWRRVEIASDVGGGRHG
ncbi:hypothetical protein [Pinisolibacter aquiterrae]|uniref:hypothetical protein n=1 Tax=Pinisolibacter aquiterrae TaxID=2815579 RepID=UPI001C3C8622|nr:hypothetical protein [Pinisolibacter aquiterrae]MBV5262981.1 hypothetical protein [Pinisolibacter aquiterrae]MCC8235322.1 hypothetical protein [Pinisolibacter aquiterrae]